MRKTTTDRQDWCCRSREWRMNGETWVSVYTVGLQDRSWPVCQGPVISKCTVFGSGCWWFREYFKQMSRYSLGESWRLWNNPLILFVSFRIRKFLYSSVYNVFCSFLACSSLASCPLCPFENSFLKSQCLLSYWSKWLPCFPQLAITGKLRQRLRKIEGSRRRGQQRMRWLDGITDSVHHQLPELAPTRVDWVSDANPNISSSVVPFSSCLQPFPAWGSFQMSSSHQVAKVLELQLQHQSFQWIFRTDFL